MAEAYNKILEDLQKYSESIQTEIIKSPYWKQFKEAPLINYFFQDCAKLNVNVNMRNLCNFVKSCSNYRKADYRYKNKLSVSLDYDDRRKGILYLTFFYFMIGLLYRRGIRYGFYNYFLLSMIFCRENFNLKTYQLGI